MRHRRCRIGDGESEPRRGDGDSGGQPEGPKGPGREVLCRPGLLTDLVSWRWVMFVNVPIGLVIFLVGRVVLVETEQRRGRFDLVGALTSTAGRARSCSASSRRGPPAGPPR